jgi:hypothetical protein
VPAREGRCLPDQRLRLDANATSSHTILRAVLENAGGMTSADRR